MKILLTLAAVLAGLAMVSVSAGGPKQAAISLDQAEPVSGSATFTVTQQNYQNPYLLWVANKCYEGGSLVTAEYHPVLWNADASVGTTDPFDVDGSPQFAIDSCTAYVWEYPASEDPERYHGNDVAVTYAVGP